MPESTSTPSSRAVFLSYASQDAKAAKRICEALRAAGVEVWFDQNELVGGDAWDQKIRRQIKECALLVPIISANTQARTEGYFRLEWRLADQRTHLMAKGRPFLLPVVVDDTRDADAAVPDSFTEVQWTKATGGELPAGFCARVQKLLDGDSVPPRADGFENGRGTNDRHAVANPARRPRWLFPVVLAGLAIAVAAGLLVTRHRPTSSAVAGAAPESPSADALRRVEAILRKNDVTRAELELASQVLTAAAQQDPANALVCAMQARVDLRHLDEYYDWSEPRKDSARRHVAQAIGLAPNLPEVRFVRALGLKVLGGDAALPEATAMFRQLALEQPTNPEVLITLAQCLRQAGDKAGALAKARESEALPGAAGRALFQRAMVTILDGDFSGGLALLQQATDREPAVEFLLWQSFIETIWLGDTARARRTLARVPADFFLEDMPASAKYFVEIRARDYEAALATMRAVPRDYVQSGAGAFSTGYLRGRALHFLGRKAAAESEWRGALTVIEKRLTAASNDRELLMSKAVLLAALGEREAAAKVWTTVTELFGPVRQHWLTLYYAAEQSSPDEMISSLAEGQNLLFWLTAAELRIDPLFDKARGDPRFTELLRAAEADPSRSPNAPTKPATTPSPAPTPPAPESEARKLAGQAVDVMYGPEGLSRERLEAADEYIRRALALDALDPRGLACAAIVDSHWVFYQMDNSDARRQQATSRVARAKLIAPADPWVQLAQAQVYMWVVGTSAMKAEAERLLRPLTSAPAVAYKAKVVLGILLRDSDRLAEAAAVNEDAGDWGSAGWAYLALGREGDALRVADRQLAIRHDPNALAQKIVALLYHRQDLAAAVRTAQEFRPEDLLQDLPALFALQVAFADRDAARIHELVGTFPREAISTPAVLVPRSWFTGWAHALAGRPELAQTAWRTALTTTQQLLVSRPGDASLILMRMRLQARLGDAAGADADARLALSLNAPQDLTLASRMAAEIALGRRERALELLVTAQKTPIPWIELGSYLRFSPEYDAIRNDPRFQKALRDHLPTGAAPLEESKSLAPPKT